MRQLRTLFVLLLLFGAANSVHARRMEMSLEELARHSQVIVSAQVKMVSTIGGMKVAEATVVRSIAGENVKEGMKLTFIAGRTWACDTSHAVAGETVLLFLTQLDREKPDPLLKEFLNERPQFDAEYTRQYDKTPFFRIANSGQGRLEVIRVQNTPCIRKPYPLQKELPKFMHSDPLWKGLPVIRLADVIARIAAVRSASVSGKK